jgi:FolB domain-containing protein
MDFDDESLHLVPIRDSQSERSDMVFVKNAVIRAEVGLDCWERKKDQPVLVSAGIVMNIRSASKDDDISKALDYGTVYNSIRACDAHVYNCVFDLTRGLIKSLIRSNPEQIQRGRLKVLLPKALSRCEGVSLDCGFQIEGKNLISLQPRSLTLKDIKLSCIIGVNPAERLKKQPIVLQVRVVGKRNVGISWNNLPSLFDSMFNVSIACCDQGSYLMIDSGSREIRIYDRGSFS